MHPIKSVYKFKWQNMQKREIVSNMFPEAKVKLNPCIVFDHNFWAKSLRIAISVSRSMFLTSSNLIVPFIFTYDLNLSRSWPLWAHIMGHISIITWQSIASQGSRWCHSFWPMTLTVQDFDLWWVLFVLLSTNRYVFTYTHILVNVIFLYIDTDLTNMRALRAHVSRPDAHPFSLFSSPWHLSYSPLLSILDSYLPFLFSLVHNVPSYMHNILTK